MSTLVALSIDLQRHVGECLTFQEVIAVGTTCRTLRKAAYDERLWRALARRVAPQEVPFSPSMCYEVVKRAHLSKCFLALEKRKSEVQHKLSSLHERSIELHPEVKSQFRLRVLLFLVVVAAIIVGSYLAGFHDYKQAACTSLSPRYPDRLSAFCERLV